MAKRISRTQYVFGQELDTLLHFMPSLLFWYLSCRLKLHYLRSVMVMWFVSVIEVFVAPQNFVCGCYKSIGS